MIRFAAVILAVLLLASGSRGEEGEPPRIFLEKKVYSVPEDIDKEIARLKLAAMGITIDLLTDAQLKYLNSWEEGT